MVLVPVFSIVLAIVINAILLWGIMLAKVLLLRRDLFADRYSQLHAAMVTVVVFLALLGAASTAYILIIAFGLGGAFIPVSIVIAAITIFTVIAGLSYPLDAINKIGVRTGILLGWTRVSFNRKPWQIRYALAMRWLLVAVVILSVLLGVAARLIG